MDIHVCLYLETLYGVLDGFIGGALWAAGNAVVPLCIQWAGLALPFLLWSITNLLMGWLVGKFGLFGVEPETVPTEWLNDLGMKGILGFIFFVFSWNLEYRPGIWYFSINLLCFGETYH